MRLPATLFCLSLLLSEAYCFIEFEITVPKAAVTGVYGEVLILPCTFPVDSSWDLSSTVITWQRGLDVVHSFYYNRDQLERQDHRYTKRTSLFVQEIARGNASLKLDKSTLQDTGVYTCSVSTNTGSQKKSFGVNIAAHYTEPRLQFTVLTDGVNLLVTSKGGYPAPTLQWLKDNSEDVTNQTQTHLMKDIHSGLYSVSGWINLTEFTNSSLTFILHNKPLEQEIRREIQLYSDKREGQGAFAHRCQGCYTLIPLILLVVIIMALIFIVFIRSRRKRQTKQNSFTKMAFGQGTQALNSKVQHDQNGYTDIPVHQPLTNIYNV